jgi:hypothetical protein
MNTNQVHQAQATVDADVPSLSACPKYKRSQVQRYARGTLRRPLNVDQPVDSVVAATILFYIAGANRAARNAATGNTVGSFNPD